MTTTWEGARRLAMDAAETAFHDSIFAVRGRIHGESSTMHQVRHATDAYLTTLSRHGWRLVPAEATLAMQRAHSEQPFGYLAGQINAATEAGDVLRDLK